MNPQKQHMMVRQWRLTSLNLLVLHTVDGRLVDPIQPVVKLQDHPFALPASPTDAQCVALFTSHTHMLCCIAYLSHTHTLCCIVYLSHTHCVFVYLSHTHSVALFTSTTHTLCCIVYLHHTHSVLYCLPLLLWTLVGRWPYCVTLQL